MLKNGSQGKGGFPGCASTLLKVLLGDTCVFAQKTGRSREKKDIPGLGREKMAKEGSKHRASSRVFGLPTAPGC